MLEAIRRYTSSWVVKGLFMVLVLSFVLWGVADVFRPGARKEWAAEIDGSQISTQAFAHEYQMQARRIRNESGTPITAEDLRRSGLPQMVIDRMINMQLLDGTADHLGLMVPTDTVTQLIGADPRFHNRQGQFDPQVFRLTLREAGLNETQYVAMRKNDLRRSQIIASIGDAVAPPEQVSDELARYFFEQRTAQYMAVPLPDGGEVGAPDRAQLQQFYDENPGLFTAPEYRTVTAIVIDANELAKNIAISQQDLEKAYTERGDEFNEPERRSFEQLIFTDASKAHEAEAKLAAGADFAKVGQEMLGQKPEDLTFADIERGSLPAALGAVVFTQPVGIIGAPVQTPLGWHIVKVTDVKPGTQRSLDQVRDTLSASLRMERATEAVIDVGNKLDDALGRGLKLEEAAQELHLDPRKYEAIDPQGLDRSGKPIAGLPPRFAATAFATSRGEESVLTEGDTNTLFVLRVDDIAPSAVKPFDVVQKELTEAWRANRRIELARQRAEGLAARIRTDGDLTAVATAEHLTVVSTPPLSRATLNAHPDVPRPVSDAIFAAGANKTFVARDADAFFVGRLTSVTEPAAATLEQNAGALKAELSRAVATDVVRQFLSALRAEHEVRVNTVALEKTL